MPSEETMKVVGILVPFIGTLLGIIWGMLNSKIAGQKTAYEALIKEQVEEMNKQRANIAKLFDKIAENEKAHQSNLIDLMKTMHQELSRKADR